MRLSTFDSVNCPQLLFFRFFCFTPERTLRTVGSLSLRPTFVPSGRDGLVHIDLDWFVHIGLDYECNFFFHIDCYRDKYKEEQLQSMKDFQDHGKIGYSHKKNSKKLLEPRAAMSL